MQHHLALPYGFYFTQGSNIATYTRIYSSFSPDYQESVIYRTRMERTMVQYTDPDREDDIRYRVVPGPHISAATLDQCAANFSQHYGVWGSKVNFPNGRGSLQGRPVRMDAKRLADQSLPEGANNVLVCAETLDGHIVGHCFVSQWENPDFGNRVWWITQLLVIPEHRNQRKATRMLQAFTKHYNIGKTSQRDFVGVLSSNPFTLCAVLRVSGRGIEAIPSCDDLESISPWICEAMMRSSPVDYVSSATITDCVKTLENFYASSANTGFNIGHHLSL